MVSCSSPSSETFLYQIGSILDTKRRRRRRRRTVFLYQKESILDHHPRSVTLNINTLHTLGPYSHCNGRATSDGASPVHIFVRVTPKAKALATAEGEFTEGEFATDLACGCKEKSRGAWEGSSDTQRQRHTYPVTHCLFSFLHARLLKRAAGPC
jgi:hypothetical protein